MNGLYALVGGILGIVVLALMAGWAEKNKSPAAWVAVCVGALLYVVWLKGWGGNVLFLTVLGLRALEHIPPFIGYFIAGGIAYWLSQNRFQTLGAAFLELAAENEKANARIASLATKLDDISGQLVRRD